MAIKNLVLLAGAALAVAGCESGDIVLQPTNIDNSTSTGGGGGGSTNPCAAYVVSGTTRQGSFDGTNCTYPSTFVSFTNPLTVNLEIPFITGTHIFQDTLAVGTNVTSGAAPASGTGPVLRIAAGNTLAFSDSSDYVLINRGSQIIAEGSAAAPITFTGFTDAVTNTASPDAVQLWGGIVINGNGITNNCTDAQRATNACHVVSEGQPSSYGGNDNADNSGSLRYVVVKHTGFEVAPDDELNGITFNAVGSGTTVSHIETYSTYDDGIEFFGGAVNVDHYVGVYVRDDSIDFSDGYVGTIDTALIIQSRMDGNRCIEGDNIGDTRAAAGVPLNTLPMTNPTITNMTCILGVQDIGTHPDVSEGPTLRRGPQMQLAGSIIYGAFADDVGSNNECFEFAGDGVTNQWAFTGATTVRNTLIACEQATQTSAGNRLPNGDTEDEWIRGVNPSTNGANYSFNTGNVIIQAADLFANANLAVLDCFYTRAAKTDQNGAAIAFTGAGAVARNGDWTANWTYGLHSGSRGQALWFAPAAPSPCGP
jgi:hypothetical protein